MRNGGKIQSLISQAFLPWNDLLYLIWHRYFKILFDNMKKYNFTNLSKHNQEDAIIKAKAIAQAMGQKI